MRAQAQGAAVVGVQVGAVAQGAGGLLAGGGETSVEFLRADGVAEGAQFPGGAADLGRHGVGGEVGADRVGVGESGAPPGDRLQDADGGGGELFGAAGPGVGERLLAGGEGVVDLAALVGEFGQEAVELREAGLQVLQAGEQPGQLVVAALGGVGGGERGGDGLAEQGRLGGELGTALPADEGATAGLEGGAGAVDAAEDTGDALQQGGADGGVARVQLGDDVGDRPQSVGEFVQPGGDGPRLGDGADGPRVRDEPFDVLALRVEGVLAGEEGDGPLPQLGEGRLGLLGEGVDAGGVGVPQLLDVQQVTVGVPQLGQSPHPGGGFPGRLAAQPADHRRDPFGGLVAGLGRPPGQVPYGLELGQHLLGRLPHRGQRAGQVAQLLLAEPVVAVGGAHAGRGERPVALGRGDPLARRPGDGQTGGDAAHQVGVAHPGQRAAAGGGVGGVRVGDVRRVPQLHRVHLGRFVAVRAQHGEGAVLRQGPAPAGQWVRDLLADGVVRQQQAPALAARVEGVQHVLAVGRAHLALELQARRVEFVRPVGSRGQAVAAGEDDALVVGQPAAGRADAVQPDHRLGEGVEHQVAVGVLLVGPYAQQDQRADPGVRDVGVGQGLEGFVDGLGVDAAGRLGVVLQLDGEGAAHRADVELAAHGDVRVAAQDMILPGGAGPLEVVRRGEHVVAFAPGIQEGRPPVLGQLPAQHADVVGLLAGAEDGQQPTVDGAQPQQPGLPVVAVQVGELPQEGGVVEQPGHGRPGQRVQVAVVQGEDVRHRGPVAPGGAAGAAEEQDVADGDDVAGHAGVLGAQPLGGGQFEAGRPELLDTAVVEEPGTVGEVGGLCGEPVAQHLVRAGVGGVVGVVGGGVGCVVGARAGGGRRARLRSGGHERSVPSRKRGVPVPPTPVRRHRHPVCGGPSGRPVRPWPCRSGR
ncbi:hypothetical protein STENM223S_00195 [Streptomyces tendae]